MKRWSNDELSELGAENRQLFTQIRQHAGAAGERYGDVPPRDAEVIAKNVFDVLS